MTPATLTLDQVAEVVGRYAGLLFEPTDIVEIQLIHKPTKKVIQRWHTASRIDRYVGDIQEYNDRGFDAYVSANPRKVIGTPGVTAKHCTAEKRCGACNDCVAIARCLFADFDDDITAFEATERIEDAGLPQASMTIYSGKGVHAYFLLDSPMPDLDEWTLFQKGLIEAVGSDPKVHDARRIMRLPPFTNHHHGSPLVCEIVDDDRDRRYPISEFPRAKPKPKRAKRPGGNGNKDERKNAVNYLARLKPERADDYEGWYQCGMILKSVDDSESMLIEWDRWSRSSPKWQDGTCAEKWATFKGNGALTIATLHG